MGTSGAVRSIGSAFVLGGALSVVACSSGTKALGNGNAKTSVVTEASAGATTTTSSRPGHQDVVIAAKGFTQLPPDSIGSSYLTYAVGITNPNPNTGDHPWVAERRSVMQPLSDEHIESSHQPERVAARR